MIWKSDSKIKFVEITKTSSVGRVRLGSLAYLIGDTAAFPHNVVNAMILVVRSGKKGSESLTPVAVEMPLVDFKDHFKDENELKILTSKSVLKVEGMLNRYRRSPITEVEVNIIPIEDRNILNWDAWQFIAFLVAQSLGLVMCSQPANPHSIVYAAKTLNRRAVRREERSLDPEVLLGQTPESVGQFILRQMTYDKANKDTKFKELSISTLGSTEMRAIVLYNMAKAYAILAKSLQKSRNFIPAVYAETLERAKHIVKHYIKHPGELENLENGQMVVTYSMGLSENEEKATLKWQVPPQPHSPRRVYRGGTYNNIPVNVQSERSPFKIDVGDIEEKVLSRNKVAVRAKALRNELYQSNYSEKLLRENVKNKIHGEGGALSEEGVDEIVKFIKSEKKFRDIFLEAGANNDPASPEVQEDIEDYGNPEE